MSVNIVKNNLKVYGLTGGIASGKTTASNFFKAKNIKIFDSDKIVKDIWENDYDLINEVNNKYKINILTKEGKLNLRNIIFNNKTELEYINSKVHPLVFKKLDQFIIDNKNEKFVIVDMPLLFEVNYHKNVFKTILIYVNKETQINRLIKRDNIKEEDALKIINNQMSLDEKKELSNYIIDNNNNIDMLYENLERVYGDILNENK